MPRLLSKNVPQILFYVICLHFFFQNPLMNNILRNSLDGLCSNTLLWQHYSEKYLMYSNAFKATVQTLSYSEVGTYIT